MLKTVKAAAGRELHRTRCCQCPLGVVSYSSPTASDCSWWDGWSTEDFSRNLRINPSLTAQMVKSLPANAGGSGDVGTIPGSGRSPGEGNDNPLQYSCLENFTDSGTCWSTVGHNWATNTFTRSLFSHFKCWISLWFSLPFWLLLRPEA